MMRFCRAVLIVSIAQVILLPIVALFNPANGISPRASLRKPAAVADGWPLPPPKPLPVCAGIREAA